MTSNSNDYPKMQNPQSVYSNSTTHRTEASHYANAEPLNPKPLALLSPREESYLLNGLVRQVELS